MKNLPFLQELTEARLFYDAKDIKGKSVSELASIVYLMIMTLEISRQQYHSYVSDYASKTMNYNTYDAMHYSGTDLGNLLAVLNNQQLFANQINVTPGVSIPLFQINRYLRDCRGSSANHNDDATFFWRLEDYLKLYQKSNYRTLRRDVSNWPSLSYAEKSRIVLLLRQEYDKLASSCDIYLWFKGSFRLTD